MLQQQLLYQTNRQQSTVARQGGRRKRPGMSGETFMRRGVQFKRKKPRRGA